MSKRRVWTASIICSALLAGCGSTSASSEASTSETTASTSGTTTSTTEATASTAEVAATGDSPAAAVSCPTSGEEWEVAKVYIEHNATDEDTGIHGLIGGAPWQSVCVTAPDGTQLWVAQPSDRLGQLGVADFFWESNEPPNDEYSIEDLMADFPAGSYVVAGTDIEGVDRITEATFTHAIPAEPDIAHPPLVPDFTEEDPPVVEATGLVVQWDPVTETVHGEPVEISGYQVIVIDEEASDPNGWARPVFDVHVGPDVTSFPIPDEFIEADTLYELEVLAIEPSGNQTISVGFFRTS